MFSFNPLNQVVRFYKTGEVMKFETIAEGFNPLNQVVRFYERPRGDKHHGNKVQF